MEQAPDFGMVHIPQELLNAYQEYKRLQDWQQLLQRVLEGEPRAVLFAEKMVTNKQVSAKMLKKYERELLPLACFYIKVKKIWYANNCIKARYVSSHRVTVIQRIPGPRSGCRLFPPLVPEDYGPVEASLPL